MVIGAWIVVGIITAAVLVAFWDSIKQWLDNTAADAVEKALGYEARNRMQKAVTHIDRFMNVIRNRTVIFSKRSLTDNMFDKISISAEANPYEIDKKVLDKIDKEGSILQKFEYTH